MLGDGTPQWFSPQAGDQVVGSDVGHAVAAGDGRAGDVRANGAVGQREERTVGRNRFGVRDVESGGEDGAVSKSLRQIGFPVNGASRGVHENSRRFHLGKGVSIEEASRRFIQVGVDRDEVGSCQEFVEGNTLGCQLAFGFFVGVPVVVEDLHVPAEAATASDGSADAPHADDAKRAADKVLADVTERFPCEPLSGTHVIDRFDDAAGGCKHQRDRHVGGGVGEYAGSVADLDAAPTCFRDVDVVVADGEVADDAKLRAGRIEELGVDRLGQERQDAVAPDDSAEEFLARRGKTVLPEVHLCSGGYLGEANVGNPASNEDFHGLG